MKKRKRSKTKKEFDALRLAASPLFDLSITVGSPAAIKLLDELQVLPATYLRFHAHGVWGRPNALDRAKNDAAILDGGPIVSSYAIKGSQGIFVITDGFGSPVDGKPSGNNFLVRSRDYFADAGLNVAVMSRVSDKTDLDYPDRIAPEHMVDIQKLVAYLKADAGLPVWLVGTSRGTVSATAAAIAFGNAELAGIVLTSSVVEYKKVGAVPTQDLAAIRIPVLVVHHENDACRVCKPYEVPAIIKGLKNAPFKKLVMVKGGSNPTGDPCESFHYHGYIGIEQETVGIITNWIKHPTSE